MNSLRRSCLSRALAIGLVMCAALLFSPSLKAQCTYEVVGISEILPSTSASQLDTYSATDMDACTAAYYDARVQSSIFEHNTDVYCSASYDGNPRSGPYITDPLSV